MVPAEINVSIILHDCFSKIVEINYLLEVHTIMYGSKYNITINNNFDNNYNVGECRYFQINLLVITEVILNTNPGTNSFP